MRSNIIQMLLNASSGKGGSDPVKPESGWTIVHFLAGDMGSIKEPKFHILHLKPKLENITIYNNVMLL